MLSPVSVNVDDGCVEMVDCITRDGKTSKELSVWMARAAKAFRYTFVCQFLIIPIRLWVLRDWFYRAVVLPTLLYGAETWAIKAVQVSLESFHNRCVRSMLKITRYQQ